RRTPRHVDPRVLQRRELLVRAPLPPRDDRPRVPHPPPGRSRHPRDEPHHRLLRIPVRLPPFGRFLFRGSSDLSDHDDPLGLGIVAEFGEAVDEVRPVERISPDADAGALSQSGDGRLVDGLVGERPRARHDADFARGVDVSRHDPDLALSGLDDPRTVRADEAGLVLVQQRLLDLDHVLLGHALGDGHDQGNFVPNGVEDGRGAERRGDVDHRRVRLDFRNGVGDGVEDGQTQMSLTALLGRDSAHHVRPVLDGLGRVEGALLPGEALADDAGVLVDPHLGVGGHGSGGATADGTGRRGRGGGRGDADAGAADELARREGRHGCYSVEVSMLPFCCGSQRPLAVMGWIFALEFLCT
ncbi:hypothetical protein ACHAWF_013394, partial [Thalassiosira exigua]